MLVEAAMAVAAGLWTQVICGPDLGPYAFPLPRSYVEEAERETGYDLQ